MKLNPNDINAYEILRYVIGLLKIKITNRSLKDSFLSHAEVSAMSGLSDILNEFYVPNLAVDITPAQLSEIPLPAIGYFDIGEGIFVVITKVEGDSIEWYHNVLGVKKEHIQDFLQKWQGFALLIQPDEKSGETNFNENKKKELSEKLRIPFVIIGLLVFCSIIFYNNYQNLSLSENIFYYSLLLIKITGTVISSLLIVYTLDVNNSFVSKLCQINSSTSCRNILDSPGAKIMGLISWSEIGLFYFGGGLLALFFLKADSLQFLKVLNFLALPYTVWSVYYQYSVAKQWCPLCLIIQILLWFEFLLGLNNHSAFTISSLPLLLAVFLFVPIVWTLLRKPLQKSIATESIYYSSQKIKFDSEYINTWIRNKVSLPPFFEGMELIKMGNLYAQHQLLFVLAPNCPNCFHIYSSVKNILSKSEDFLAIFLLAGSMNENDKGGKVARIILSQNSTNDMAAALDMWFSDKSNNIDKWGEKINSKLESEKGHYQMNLYMRWMDLAGITETPSKYLNESKIPNIYSGQDLLKLSTIIRNNSF